MCSKCCRNIRIIFALITLILFAIDVGTEWYLFSKFIKSRDEESSEDFALMISLGVVTALATILFFLEIKVVTLDIKLGKKEQDDEGSKEENVKLNKRNIFQKKGEKDGASENGEKKQKPKNDDTNQRWTEAVSLLQTLIEDLPTCVILYQTFRLASCQLYTEIVDGSFARYFSLISIFISALWKVLGLVCWWCCCGRCRRKQEAAQCTMRSVCFVVRVLHGVLAVGVGGVVVALFYISESKNQDMTLKCESP